MKNPAADLAATGTPGPWVEVWGALAYVETITDPDDPTGQTPMPNPVQVATAGEEDRRKIRLLVNALPAIEELFDALNGRAHAGNAQEGYLHRVALAKDRLAAALIGEAR